jgi:hypothetical protein
VCAELLEKATPPLARHTSVSRCKRLKAQRLQGSLATRLHPTDVLPPTPATAERC